MIPGGRRIVTAFLVRDVRVVRSYRAALLGQVTGTLLFLASFAVVAPIVTDGFADEHGAGYVAFAAVGIAVTGALLSALQAFSESVREAQLEGTLETVLMAPVRREAVVAAMGAYPLLAGVGAAALTLVVATALAGGFDVHPASAALALVVSVAAFAALGLLAAAAVVVVKRGNPLATLVGMAGAVTAGAYAPVDTFPGWLQGVAAANPMTYALDAWRAAVLRGEGPGAVAGDLAVLAAVAVVLGPLSWWALRRAIDVARRDGTLVTY